VTLGIWAGGLLIYTILVRVTVPVLTGRLTYDQEFSAATDMRSPGVAAPPEAHS
jgi:hypothetical protein